MSYLTDSDVLIDALNGIGRAIETLDRYSGELIVISSISFGEILDGAIGSRYPEKRVASAHGFLQPFPLILPTAEIMTQLAHLRVDLRRSGQIIPDFDLVIAATAIVHDLTLITRNRRHYERISALKLLNE